MNYVKAIGIKFIFTFIILSMVLGIFYDVGFNHILIISLIITAASFVLGDLLVLRWFENWGATIADFLMIMAIIWFYGANTTNIVFPLVTGSALSALFISIGEVFFHKYVDRHILHVDERVDQSKQINTDQFQTEMSEENINTKNKDE